MARSKQKAMNGMPFAWSPGTITHVPHWKTSWQSTLSLSSLQSLSSSHFCLNSLFLLQNCTLPLILESEKGPFTTALKCYRFCVLQTPGQQLKRRNFVKCSGWSWLLMPPHASSLDLALGISALKLNFNASLWDFLDLASETPGKQSRTTHNTQLYGKPRPRNTRRLGDSAAFSEIYLTATP